MTDPGSSALRTGRTPRSVGERITFALGLWARGLWARSPMRWWVRLAAWNRVLLVAFVVVGATGALRATKPVEADEAWNFSEAAAATATEDQVAHRATDDSGARFDTRRLFRAPPPRKPVKAPKPQPVSNVTLSQLSRHLTLRGIVGGNPSRAILYDERSRQTVYAAPGDFIGEIRVKEVRKDAVLLSWKSEILELAL